MASRTEEPKRAAEAREACRSGKLVFKVFVTKANNPVTVFPSSLPDSSEVKCRLWGSTFINGLGNTAILVQSNKHNVYSARETYGNPGKNY